MPTPRTLDELVAVALAEGVPEDYVRAAAKTAVQLLCCADDDAVGRSRLGGLPDLPESISWPFWDVSEYDHQQIIEGERMAGGSPKGFWKQRLDELRSHVGREPLPLSFIAQINLRELNAYEHGLPLPEEGYLWFFDELTEQPWGFCPTNRGSFCVLYAPEDVKLHRTDPPDELPEDLVLSSSVVGFRQTITLPNVPPTDELDTDGYYQLSNLLRDNDAPHQMGGCPDQIQGDMPRACSLVTKGIYLGHPPDIPEDELERLAADAGSWRLLLQIGTDDDLEWMWGDMGNLYWWMRNTDIASGNWDAAWFKLQCC